MNKNKPIGFRTAAVLLIGIAVLSVGVFKVFFPAGKVVAKTETMPVSSRSARLPVSGSNASGDGQLSALDMSPEEAREALAAEVGATTGAFEAELVLLSAESGERKVSGRVLLVSESGDYQVWADALDGSWKGTLPDQVFGVAGIEGEESVLDFECDSSLSAKNPKIEVFVNEATTWFLKVVDSETGKELEGLTLLSFSESDRPPPMDLLAAPSWAVPTQGVEVVLRDAKSPLSVSEDDSRGFFWLSCPDYASEAIRRNRFQRHGLVEMHRSGTLAVRVGALFARKAMAVAESLDGTSVLLVVRLDQSSRPVLEATVEARTHEMELPAGRYSVTVLARGQGVSGLTLFREEVELLGGGSKVVEVDALAPSATKGAESVPLNLTVVLPEHLVDVADWAAQLIVKPFGSDEWAPVVQESLSEWDPQQGVNMFVRRFIAVSLGQYRLHVEPSGHKVEFVLDEVGAPVKEIILDCSDIAMLRLELPENQAGGEKLTACLTYLDGGKAVGGLRTSFDPNSRTTQVLCEPRRLRVQLVGATRASQLMEVVAIAGEERTVHLELSESNLSLVVLTAWAQDSHALVDSDFWSSVSIEGIGHPGRLVEKRFGSHGTGVSYGPNYVEPDWSRCVLVLTPPGSYKIEVPGQEQALVIDAPPGLSEHSVFLE